jgi:thiol-disulfide isomerase/thioredoxin
LIITSRFIKWWSPGLSRAFAVMIILFLPALAEADTGTVIPHAGERAKEQFQQYQYSSKHKAFAIAPGGAWYWLTELESEEQAETQVLQNCQESTQQKCVLYALDNRIVFDAEKWPSLWGPYADAATASKATEGVNVGQRFPDLTWLDKKGKRVSPSALKGKITFLHFWGSWCPPCMREFPSLNKLHVEMKKRYPDDVAMVLMQLREPFDESMKWVQQYGFSDMPLYDSGVKDSETTTLMLKDGRQVKDREIARVFPSTYVLDRNGLVLFSHYGPVDNWLDYVAFFEHAVKAGTRASTGTKYKDKPGD